jgi:hypothetical protein
MSTPCGDPLHWIAERVADCFAESGYAFVEDDKIPGLAAVLGSFLTVAGIPVNADTAIGEPVPTAGALGGPMTSACDRSPVVGVR